MHSVKGAGDNTVTLCRVVDLLKSLVNYPEIADL